MNIFCLNTIPSEVDQCKENLDYKCRLLTLELYEVFLFNSLNVSRVDLFFIDILRATEDN